MSLSRLDPVDGEAHGVRVHIEGLPVLECTKGHRWLVAPDFAVKFVEALRDDDGLIPMRAALPVGPFRQRYGCPACGTRLVRTADHHVEARRVLELNGGHAFGVRVDVPTFQCSACGQQCAPPDAVVLDDLLKASADALQSVNGSPR